VFWLARHGATVAEARSVDLRAEISTEVTEAIQTAAERRRWQAVTDVLDRLGELGNDAMAATQISARWSTLARAKALILAGLAMASIALTATASDPILALLILTPLALADPIASLADAGVSAARVRAAQARLDALLSTEPAIVEVADPAPITGAVLTLDHPAVRRGARTLLAEVEAQLPVGGILAVRGANGSGKSTLAALLLRFLDPDHGAVRLGETDLQTAAAADVRRTVGLVDDDPHVFASTVAENIRFAKPGSSDAEIAQALRDAQLEDWLADLPDGLDTRLGDGYAEVSGGERARLGIARSLLAGHDVLVLDEPTAHLDTATADRLRNEIGGPGRPPTRSVVWIAHDTYPDADITIELTHEVGAVS
jgi:ATP-binding cassette subfamily C protein CydCD